MKVHVFNCEACKDIWTLPARFLTGEPRDECKKCGGPLRHGEVEVTPGV